MLRLALLVYNLEQIGGATAGVLAEAFLNGLRFDLRLVVIACLPLLLALPSLRAMSARGLFRGWLTVFASLTLFLGVVELDFYREFNQRLNGLVLISERRPEDGLEHALVRLSGCALPDRLGAGRRSFGVAVWKASMELHAPTTPRCPLRAAFKHAAGQTGRVSDLRRAGGVRIARHPASGPPLRWGDAFTTGHVRQSVGAEWNLDLVFGRTSPDVRPSLNLYFLPLSIISSTLSLPSPLGLSPYSFSP